MKDADIDALSADGGQNGHNQPTDPRAALAEHLRIAAPSSARLGQDGALLTIDRLAERGVLLVTLPLLVAAWERHPGANDDLHECGSWCAEPIFAALSAEATE